MCWTRSAACSAPNWRRPRRNGTSSSPPCSCIAPWGPGGRPPSSEPTLHHLSGEPTTGRVLARYHGARRSDRAACALTHRRNISPDAHLPRTGGRRSDGPPVAQPLVRWARSTRILQRERAMSHNAAWLPLGMLLGVDDYSGCASSSQRDAKIGNVGWAMYNMSYDGVRSSPLSEINVGNVKNLRPVCRAKLGEEGSFTAGPVV